MEINLNNNGFGNVGIGRETLGANGVGAGTKDVARHNMRDALTITHAKPTDGIASAEPIADVPDAALVRDDALGKLVNSAFNLPPPPMPSELV